MSLTKSKLELEKTQITHILLPYEHIATYIYNILTFQNYINSLMIIGTIIMSIVTIIELFTKPFLLLLLCVIVGLFVWYITEHKLIKAPWNSDKPTSTLSFTNMVLFKSLYLLLYFGFIVIEVSCILPLWIGVSCSVLYIIGIPLFIEYDLDIVLVNYLPIFERFVITSKIKRIE
ncbi:hypothetical protein QTN25_008534 [Entamoeba marina]